MQTDAKTIRIAQWTRGVLGSLLLMGAMLLALNWQAQAAYADDDLKHRGIITAMPASADLLGEWTVGGRVFIADANTEFDQEEGQLAVGVCAKVAYRTTDAGLVAEEIDSEPADCDGAPGDDNPGNQHPGAGQPGNVVVRFGHVDVMPTSGLSGTWVISGTTYTADANTEFHQEHGGFAVGVCVKVKTNPATPSIAKEIETEQEYKCNRGDHDGDGKSELGAEMFGVLQQFPADLIGEWRISDIAFQTDATTQFKQRHGAFVVGGMVKVHFIDDNSVKLAREIETVFDRDDDGADHDGNGCLDGAQGHAFGPIDSFPADLVGVWTIAGVPYTATQTTKFKQEDGAFGTGVLVKVEYHLDSAGNRIAHEIETTHDRGQVGHDNHFKLVGYVQEKPATGFVGQWLIANEQFSATLTSKFEEEHGLLVVGAYVEVEYAVVDNQRLIRKIETQVPPGAGDDDRLGTIESLGGDSLSASSLSVTGSTWRIDGVEYVVTAATDLNDSTNSLAVGSAALVNSYQASDGQQVATRITGLALVNRTYLPIMQR
jgi:hypothetical protein